MTFVLKKILTLALMPLSIGLLAVWLGVICWWLRRGLRGAKVFASCGVLLLTVLSYSGIANRIIKPLEMCYPPLVDANALQNVKWVLVLCGGHVSETGLPGTLQLSGPSLARLVEGIRIHRELPGSMLVFSGGAVFDPVPEAETMAAVANDLGVDADQIVLEKDSRDTAEQAKMLRCIVKEDGFVLVTSAHHMPRSVRSFEDVGLKPIPAPADFISKQTRATSPFDFFPRASALRTVEVAVHEYLGLLWSAVKGAS